MKYAVINMTGDILSLCETEAEAQSYIEQYNNTYIAITDEAAELAQKIGNLRDCDKFYYINDLGKGLITLKDKVKQDNNVWVTFKMRAEALAKFYDKIDKEKLTDAGDILVSKYMQASEPIWRIYNVSSDSVAVIANAKLDEDHIENKPIFFTSSTTPLFLNVMEFIYIPEENLYGYSLALTPSSDIRMILYFNHESEDTKKLLDATKHFLASFYALKSCEKTPIVINNPQERKNASKGFKLTKGISSYNVSLSKRYRAKKQSLESILDKSDKTLILVSVSGFVRTQHYGPGRMSTKKIWVDGFTRGQWVRNGLVYVTLKS